MTYGPGRWDPIPGGPMTTDARRAREDLSAGCLDLVRRQIEALGMDMTHCPPLM